MQHCPFHPFPLSLPLRHMCPAEPTGNCKAWKYFPNIFPCTQTNTCVCQAHTLAHTVAYLLVHLFINTRARSQCQNNVTSVEGEEREPGAEWGKRHKSSAACEGEQKNVLNIQGKNHVVAAAAASVGVGVDCGTLRQDAKFNFTCGK